MTKELKPFDFGHLVYCSFEFHWNFYLLNNTGKFIELVTILIKKKKNNQLIASYSFWQQLCSFNMFIEILKSKLWMKGKILQSRKKVLIFTELDAKFSVKLLKVNQVFPSRSKKWWFCHLYWNLQHLFYVFKKKLSLLLSFYLSQCRLQIVR